MSHFIVLSNGVKYIIFQFNFFVKCEQIEENFSEFFNSLEILER